MLNFKRVLLVLSCITTTALAIQCYECSSYVTPECGEIDPDTPNKTGAQFLHTCEPRDGKVMFCRKTIQVIIIKPDIERITRSCGWISSKGNKSVCVRADNDFKLETNCQCFEEGCNAGNAVTPLAPVQIAAVSLIAYRIYGLLL